MKTIKVTYVLELEVPADAMISEGNDYVREIRRMLRWNESRGWKARLRQLLGVDKGDGRDAAGDAAGA